MVHARVARSVRVLATQTMSIGNSRPFGKFRYVDSNSKGQGVLHPVWWPKGSRQIQLKAGDGARDGEPESPS